MLTRYLTEATHRRKGLCALAGPGGAGISVGAAVAHKWRSRKRECTDFLYPLLFSLGHQSLRRAVHIDWAWSPPSPCWRLSQKHPCCASPVKCPRCFLTQAGRPLGVYAGDWTPRWWPFERALRLQSASSLKVGFWSCLLAPTCSLFT